MAKRSVSAFGADGSDESRAAVTSGKVPARGVQHDATPSKNDEPPKKEKRSVRAFGFVGRFKEGPLQQDEARGSRAERQFASPGETGSHLSPVESTGRTLAPVDPYFAADCQGRSGQPDNQEIFRGKGRT